MSAALVLLLLAADGDVASRVQAKLVQREVLTGTFEQSKQVKGFKRPFRSSGTYEVKKGAGVKWNTAAPFASQLTVTADEIRSMQGSEQLFALDAKTEPTVKVITQLLFSLLAGDFAVLSQHFDARGAVEGEGWSIELVPKAGPLTRAFTRISLKGDAFVRSVTLHEESGDVTLISLAPAP